MIPPATQSARGMSPVALLEERVHDGTGDRPHFAARPRRPPYLGVEFVGHGAFGVMTKQAWVHYFTLFSFPEAWA